MLPAGRSANYSNTMHIILVFGEKPLPSGQMHPELGLRLEKAMEIINKDGADLLVISGGQTRHNAPSEAEMGQAYLGNKISIPILLEKNARSTSENIRFTRKLLADRRIDRLTVITGHKRLWRVKYLCRGLWADLYSRTTFIGATDLHSFWYYGAELVYFFFAIVDPAEKYAARLTKKIFRNTT